MKARHPVVGVLAFPPRVPGAPSARLGLHAGGAEHDVRPASARRGLTLLETLLVVSTVAVLASVLLPGLSAARNQAQAVVCRSNVAQIMLANRFYAEDHRGVYVPGASEPRRNLHRWHGVRDRPGRPFDGAKGPLARYLGPEGTIRECPQFDSRLVGEKGGFERGCGGYGYNNAFVGVQVERQPSGRYVLRETRAGTFADRIARPAETLMFADCAFAAQQLIEYSFAEPRFHPQYPTFRADPSIHFRHRGWSNIGWCDGHVDAQRRTFTWSSGLYRADPDRLGLGWFGTTDDNEAFGAE